LNEIPAEVLANKALKKDAVATINALQKAGIAELNKSKPALDSAKKAVDKIEDLLGAAALSTFPTAAVEKAMNDWVASRQAAIDGITELSRKINEAFAGDQTQKGDVLKALKKLGQLQIKLQNGLDNKLKAAINTKNIKAQEESVKGARQSVSSLRDFMQKDELIMNIDKHDVPGVPSLTVVSDMLKSLNAIETALPH
jgi:cysteinyl-tRNA synthetase